MATGEIVEYWPWPDDEAVRCGRVVRLTDDEVSFAEVDPSGFEDGTDVLSLEELFGIARHTRYLARLEAFFDSPPTLSMPDEGSADVFAILRTAMESHSVAAIYRPNEDDEPLDTEDGIYEEFAVEAIQDAFVRGRIVYEDGMCDGVVVLKDSAIAWAKVGGAKFAQTTSLYRIQQRQNAANVMATAMDSIGRCARSILREYGTATSANRFCEVGDSFGSFTGHGSPLTQALGYLAPSEIEGLADFYRSLGAEWEVAVGPNCHSEALATLLGLGAKPSGFENEYILALPRLFFDRPMTDARIEVQEVATRDMDVWCETLIHGLAESEPDLNLIELVELLACVGGCRRFMATWEGRPVGACSMFAFDDLAYLAGMVTLPGYRGRGVQTSMIEHRLRVAQSQGAKLALVTASPGTSSERNILHAGFRLAYTRLGLRVPAI